jgi:hypothetical protein
VVVVVGVTLGGVVVVVAGGVVVVVDPRLVVEVIEVVAVVELTEPFEPVLVVVVVSPVLLVVGVVGPSCLPLRAPTGGVTTRTPAMSTAAPDASSAPIRCLRRLTYSGICPPSPFPFPHNSCDDRPRRGRGPSGPVLASMIPSSQPGRIRV